MVRFVPALLFFILALHCFLAEGSHFRYGFITWAPTDSDDHTVRFTFRVGWRRSEVHCNQSTIANGDLIRYGGQWTATCDNVSNPLCMYSAAIAYTYFYCTDYSEIEDWSIGENTFNYTFNSTDEEWFVSYYGCCWISLSWYSGNGNWLVATTVNLTRRSDNGRINSSPVSRSSAIVRFQEGCSKSIRIPVEDPDGDVVKCRFASYSESYKNNDSFPYGVLDEKSCVLKYEGTHGTTGTYAVALTLEDFPAGTTNFGSIKPFSTVGLQFLVMISSQSGSCDEIPVFTDSSPQDGECYEVQIGLAYRAAIEVQVSDFSKHIVEIITSSPTGMHLTPLRYNGGIYYRNVTWFANQNQVGQQVFCFWAVDSNGLESERRCITILAGLSNTPRVILGSRMPRNPTSKSGPGFVRWNLQFDRLIKKPRTSSYIRLVLLPNGHTVYKVDTLSQYVTIDSNHTTLHFEMPNAALSMNGSYAILIDRGAVVGQGCSYDGPPTPGITSLSDWYFSVDGRCPSGYYLAPPEFSSCVDINECGTPSRFKRSGWWWGWSSPSVQSTTSYYYTFTPTTSSSYLPSSVQPVGCNETLGMENGEISDGQISASSEWLQYNSTARSGRLNFHGEWSPRISDVDHWLQVDLIIQNTTVRGVATQGSKIYSEWVTMYKLQYSNDEVNFLYYKERGQSVDKEFVGNVDQNTIVYYGLHPPIRARYIRFRPLTWKSHISMRVELYDCLQATNTTLAYPYSPSSVSTSATTPANLSSSVSKSATTSAMASPNLSSSVSKSASYSYFSTPPTPTTTSSYLPSSHSASASYSYFSTSLTPITTSSHLPSSHSASASYSYFSKPPTRTTTSSYLPSSHSASASYSYFSTPPTRTTTSSYLPSSHSASATKNVTSVFAESSVPVQPNYLDFEFYVPADCDQTCSNTPGSYTCSCVSGYRLDSDGKSCIDINECFNNNGGCSHHCFNIPGSFYCGCPEGITMASNNLTCVDASMSVTCNDNNMTVSLEKRTFKFFEVSQLHLRYASCRATQNSTHLLISTPLNGCGTLVNETEDALMFWNEVLADAVIIDFVVTRTHDIKVPFYCSYSRKILLSLSFTPQRIYFGTEAGYGNFTFKMDFYKSSSFSTPYTDQDYPLEVELNDYMYVRFSVESSADLVIMAENCKATKYGSFYSWPQYTIIQNGCPRDTTLDYSYDPSRSFQQFKFKTFRFFNDYDTVYFHCELLACHRYSPKSRCSASCSASNKRKRREVTRDEVEHDESTTKQVLTGGPLVIKEMTESPDPGDPGKSKQAALIGGVAAAGGFGLIAVAALAVVFVKYRIARRLMNRNKVGDLYTTQDEQLSRKHAFYIQEDDMIEKDDAL
ncbi:uncharacterized protein LOC144642207 isoform X3 [Oculina patagonica]